MLNWSLDLLLCFIWPLPDLAHAVQCILRTGILYLRGRADQLPTLHVELYQDGLARLGDPPADLLQERPSLLDAHYGHRLLGILQHSARDARAL